jgi:hypothetical protein
MQRFRMAMFGGYYLLVVAFPLFAFAQGAGLPTKIVPCDGVNCTVCDLATLAQNIINTGIFVFVFLSALLFAYAGFLYLTNSAIDKVSEAKSIFKNVTLGLVILLAAWLVVDTLMKSVLGGSFGPWNDICRAVGL